jgi:hypothetical protein
MHLNAGAMRHLAWTGEGVPRKLNRGFRVAKNSMQLLTRVFTSRSSSAFGLPFLLAIALSHGTALAGDVTQPAIDVLSTGTLAEDITNCLDTRTVSKKGARKTIKDVRDSSDSCRKARSALAPARATASSVSSEQPKIDAAASEALNASEAAKDSEVPAFTFGDSNWSLTVQAFLGLTRVAFGDKKAGTTDQFAPLSGVGSGVKLRYNYVTADEKVKELVGLSGGLYFEPKVPVGVSAGGESSAQTLSAMIVLSTFEYLYLGFGWKFASTEPAYDRGIALRNFMLVFGLGADGKSLTN